MKWVNIVTDENGNNFFPTKKDAEYNCCDNEGTFLVVYDEEHLESQLQLIEKMKMVNSDKFLAWMIKKAGFSIKGSDSLFTVFESYLKEQQ